MYLQERNRKKAAIRVFFFVLFNYIYTVFPSKITFCCVTLSVILIMNVSEQNGAISHAVVKTCG